MSATTSVNGLISGLNTSDLIDQIIDAERASVRLLETRQAKASALRSVFQTLNSKLLALETSARALTSASAFRGRTVSVSDTSVLDVAVASGATAGTYEVTVDSLAAAHRIASQGFADTASTTLGTGEIQIQVGNGETVAITVDSSNNTLEGLRSAINASGAGVTAMIINDGSAAVPYRLVLTAKETGAANTISVTSTLGGGTAPEFSANSISEAVADGGNAYSGTVATSGAYTGASNRSYLVEIVEGGSLAEATYRVSEDGGLTWGSTLSLAGGTIGVYDDAHGSDLGVAATFDDGTFAAGDRFTIDAFVPTVQEAADARLTIGSGAGAITVTSASNTVGDVLPGLTFDLRKADPGESVTIRVENDVEGIQAKIQEFVDSYNSVHDYLRAQTRYDATSGEANLLLGNASAMKVQNDLRSVMLGTVAGLDGGLNGLYAIGISVSSTGTLSVDTDELADALTDNLDDVARIFRASGESTHAKISFVGASSATAASEAGYAVHITQAATRGSLAGTTIADPAIGGLTIGDTNDKLVLKINGVETSELSLAHKTYHSGAELANEIAAKIAASTASVGSVEVRFVDEGATGHFEIRTAAYGSTRSVELGTEPANSASAVLGLAGGTSTQGQDVAGTIDGVEATGSGQLLRVTDESSPANGLQISVALTPEEIGGGVDAVVTVVKGVAKQSQDLLDYLTDPLSGFIKSKQDRYTAQIDSYADRIERREELLEKRRARLVKQFTALEQALSALQTQSSYLSTQVTSLSSMTSGS